VSCRVRRTSSRRMNFSIHATCLVTQSNVAGGTVFRAPVRPGTSASNADSTLRIVKEQQPSCDDKPNAPHHIGTEHWVDHRSDHVNIGGG
jgi:hypothetical protein